jgi:hypothetical protein
MPSTYDLVSDTTLSTAAASVAITSIPATYTDLRVVIFVPTYSSSNQDSFLTFNGDTGANYNYMCYNQNNASAGNLVSGFAGTQFNYSVQTIYTTPTYPSLYTLDIFNYTSSTDKTVLVTASQTRSNSASNLARTVHRFATSSAISSFTLTVGGGQTYSVGTRVTLYGILKA